MSSVRPHRKAIYTSNQTNGKGGSSTHTPTTHRTRRLSSKRSARGRLRSAFIQPVASSRRWWSWWWCGRFGFGGGARGARGRTRTRTRQRTRGRRSLPHAARARARHAWDALLAHGLSHWADAERGAALGVEVRQRARRTRGALQPDGLLGAGLGRGSSARADAPEQLPAPGAPPTSHP